VPKLDRRTKTGKARYEELAQEASARGLTMIDEETWARAEAIKDAVYRHKAAAVILCKGKAEEAVFGPIPRPVRSARPVRIGSERILFAT